VVAEATKPFALEAEYARRLLPARDPEGHKFSFGRVVTVCGSLDYAGAAFLTSLAAIRGGAGLVAMAVPETLRPALAARLPEAILVGLPEFAEGQVKVDAAVEAITDREPDALVVGPGLKETDDYSALVFKIVSQVALPTVIDAGALNMLAKTEDWWSHAVGELILTPHAGEFARLTGDPVGATDDERAARAIAAARQFDSIVVLKGARTVVAASDGPAAVAPFVNPALATAGSGDVLAGVVGALLAQKLTAFDAACLGVYLHGRAGERLSFRMGNAGLLASEIANEIPPTRHELDAHSG
jgi:NAD(P)H-hydrate epimerase